MNERADGLDYECAKILTRIYLTGPLERARISERVIKLLDGVEGLIEPVRIDGLAFYDLSGQGRYHMTGEHAAIDEKPWRPSQRRHGFATEEKVLPR
jgi:hypothetical protein